MPQVFQLHIGEDTVVQLQFPPRNLRQRWWQSPEVAYDDQTFQTLPELLCTPYGLDQEWGFRLQESTRIAVFVPVRPEFSGLTPPLAVGGIFPCLTRPVELEVVGGLAIALIELDEEIDLREERGHMTMFVEKLKSGRGKGAP